MNTKVYPIWTTDGQRVKCATSSVSVERDRPASDSDPASYVTIGDVKRLDAACPCRRHHWSTYESEHLTGPERMERIRVESGVRT